MTMMQSDLYMVLYFTSQSTLLIPNTYASPSLFLFLSMDILPRNLRYLSNSASTDPNNEVRKFTYLFIYLVHFLTVLIGSMRKYFSYINKCTLILIEYWENIILKENF